MSLTDLASLLNQETRAGNASVTESDTDLIASELAAGLTLRLLRLAKDAGLTYSTYDHEYSQCDEADIVDDFGTFRLKVKKPSRSPEDLADALYIMTEVGFSDFLRRGNKAGIWRILGLSAAFSCQARAFGNWDEPLTLTPVPATKSPRMLVKEAADVRSVPEDIRLLLLQGSNLDELDPFHRLWAEHAHASLTRCIANEVSAGDQRLIFKGPPKLSLEFQERSPGDSFNLKDFQLAQEAASWVYENAREAEMKHVLLSTEIARSGRADGEVIAYFRDNLDAALECAKIAYQMSISEITKDTLKSLGDLRKAVTDETSKATDATRQTVTAITTAAGVGIGLAVARISVALNPWLILAVMIIVWLYVVTIAWSGWHFILVQRGLRKQWQTKLYRFLSAGDYEAMVTIPVGRSETVFKRTAISGVGVLAAWVVCVVVFAFLAKPSSPVTPKADHPSEHPTGNVLEPGTPQERRRPTAPSIEYFRGDWAFRTYPSSTIELYVSRPEETGLTS
ncbi:hypothetical protein PMI36_03105 [Pseudomonas sp. GM79]|uniref:hypothetical protein n=1 Tax=Pseudomonas sp. GM79 TaxID=1144338 RepID=UPI00026F5926|nr:hypothetical protein [Pseudomonas sp. GM79]EJN22624.1 hypothetical protein PMI36_03105 [Pseudomonas sp. GM79]